MDARAHMRLVLEPHISFGDDCLDRKSFLEPGSPDSGFSSDESLTPDATFAEIITRSKTLPSALRRSRSKQSAKRVRFADSLGLDLEKHQYIVEESLISRVQLFLPSISSFENPTEIPTQRPRLVLANFNYRSEHEYDQMARDEKVCVAALRASGNSVVGQVNLLNMAFDKDVTIRYTVDNWMSQEEVNANFSHRSLVSEDVDAFNFTIMLPNKIRKGNCEFCVRYLTANGVWWDNNNGSNYIINITDSPAFISSGPTPRSTFGTIPTTGMRKFGNLPSIPSYKSSIRRQSRRWGKSSDESDDETSTIFYIPSRRK